MPPFKTTDNILRNIAALRVLMNFDTCERLRNDHMPCTQVQNPADAVTTIAEGDISHQTGSNNGVHSTPNNKDCELSVELVIRWCQFKDDDTDDNKIQPQLYLIIMPYASISL